MVEEGAEAAFEDVRVRLGMWHGDRARAVWEAVSMLKTLLWLSLFSAWDF